MTSERTRRRSSRARRAARPSAAGTRTPKGSRAMNPESYRAQLADLANGTRLTADVLESPGPTIYRPHLELDADPMPVVVGSGGSGRRPVVSAWANKRRSKKSGDG